MNALRAIFLGFLKPSTYADACFRWHGAGFGLLILLILLGALFLSWKTASELNDFCRNQLPQIASQVPEIRFIDGSASTPEAKRYEVVDPESGKILAVINTASEDTPADLGGAAFAFLGKHSMTVRRNALEQRSYSYDQWESFTLNDEFIAKASSLAQTWSFWVISPFIFLGMLITRSVQWLFFALPISLYMKSRQVTGDFPAALRLSALAMTPVILIDMILSTFSQSIPFAGWAFMAAVILIGFAGVEFARGETSSNASQDPPPSMPHN